MKIKHIINPVVVPETSDLFIAQPVTFESMRVAKQNATKKGVDVELLATCYQEDESLVPSYFNYAGQMERSVLDVGSFQRKRKLPLICDILDKVDYEDDDIIIYTNVDIAVQPEFYLKVKEIYDGGLRAFTINRRTIPQYYTSPTQLSDMYKEHGEKHPGHDCFVFTGKMLSTFNLGLGCIGANWIGRILLTNLMAHCEEFETLPDEFLTFHIGDDRSWKVSELNDYDMHNESELLKVIEYLLSKDEVVNVDELITMHSFHLDNLQCQKVVKLSTFSRDSLKLANLGITTHYKGSGEWKLPVFLNQEPIFIVGHPRSGTTLLQSLLMTCNEVVSIPETHFFSIVRHRLKVSNDRIDISCMDDVIFTIRKRFPLSVETEALLKDIAENGNLSPKMLFEIVVLDGLVTNYDPELVRNCRFVEKTPDHVEYLDIIFRFYPNAKIINIVRNPEKAILSRRQNFIGEKNWPIETHAVRWKDSIVASEKYTNDSRFYSVKFEDLVKDKSGVMSAIAKFLNINIIEDKLDEYKDRAKLIALPWENWKENNSKELATSIAERAERSLSESDLKVLSLITGSVSKKHGYNLDCQSTEPNINRENNVVIFSHVASHPQNQGNSKRVYSVCKKLKDLGYNVSFFYNLVHPNMEVDYKAMMDEWDDVYVNTPSPKTMDSQTGYYDIDHACDNPLISAFSDYVKARNAGVVICNYVFYSKVLDGIDDDIYKVIDTHDKFSDRHLKLKNRGVSKELWWYSFTSDDEGRGLDRADLVLAIQKEEASFFTQITSSAVEVLPQIEDVSCTPIRLPKKLLRVGFIGSNNPINVDTCSLLLQCYKEHPELDLPELIVCGAVCDSLTFEDKRVKLKGKVKDVSDFYKAIDCALVPIEFGSGLKIKAIEALSYNKPILTTRHGSIGLGSNNHYLNFETVNDLVLGLSELYHVKSDDHFIQHVEYCTNLYQQYVRSAHLIFNRLFNERFISAVKNEQQYIHSPSKLEENHTVNSAKRFLTVNAPPIKQTGKSALFIGHGFHLKTRSSQFFIKYLEKLFNVSFHWEFPHEQDTGKPKGKLGAFDIVFFWQIMPSQELVSRIECENIVCIPMYDGTGVYLDGSIHIHNFEPFKNRKFISFSRVLHRSLKENGFDSYYVQYAPYIEPKSSESLSKRSEKPKLFFNYRKEEISFELIKQLIEPSDIESLHIHITPDPRQDFTYPSPEDIAKYKITFSEWFDNSEDLKAIINQHDVFIAPRLYEGIGMAFLGAMALGKCVIAPNLATMNEYIKHGETGLLYDHKNPEKLDLSKWFEIGLSGQQKLGMLHHRFETSLKYVYSFICAPSSQLQLASSSQKYVGQSLRTVLLVFPHNPFLQSNGVQARFFSLLKYFKSRNVKVDIFSHENFVDSWGNKEEFSDYFRHLYLSDFAKEKNSGLSYQQKSPLPDFSFVSLRKNLRKILNKNKYDLFLMGYVHWAHLVDEVKDTPTAIMVEDCISVNIKERAASQSDFDLSSSLNDEIERVNKYDTAIYISDTERVMFTEKGASNKSFCIPHAIEATPFTHTQEDFQNRKYDLLFVGSDNPFNVEAINWFLDNAWPLIDQQVSLAVAGDVSNSVDSSKIDGKSRVHLLGRVDDLSDLYSNSKVAICPMLHGTGLKIKIIEALSFGLPVISLPSGFEGLKTLNQSTVKAENAQDFALKVQSVINSYEEWKMRAEFAVDLVENHYSINAVYTMFDEVFKNR
ncbi:glycosyltransferase [Alteromonas marina]